MARYTFSKVNGSTLGFDPAADELRIDTGSASDLVLRQVSGGLQFVLGGGSVTLTGVPLARLGTSNVRFSDRSRLLVGDNNSGATNDDAANTLRGGSTNDLLVGLGGNDSLDGAGGNDTALFLGNRSDYAIRRSGGTIVVTDLVNANGDEGTDTIVNVERLRFADGDLATSAILEVPETIAPPPPPPAGTTTGNTAPVATNDTGATTEGGEPVRLDVLANDTDPDAGDTLTIVAIDVAGTAGWIEILSSNGVGAPVWHPGIPAVQGTAAISADGKAIDYAVGGAFQYLAAGATATETIKYTVADPAGATSTATLVVTVTGTNDGPVAVADAVVVSKGDASATIEVLANDTDIDAGDTRTIVSIATTGLLGSASIGPGGTSILYSPGAAFASLGTGQSATETLAYTIADASGATSTAAVTITVMGGNRGPVAVNDTATATENGGPVVIDALANDTDPDSGDTRTIVGLATSGMSGAAVIGAGGASIVYSVGNAFQSLGIGQTALDTFSYSMRDAAGAMSTANVAVVVHGTNDGPVAVNDALTIAENAAPAVIQVLGNDTDSDAGDTKRVVSIDASGLLGTAAIAPNGASVSYSTGSAFAALAVGQTATESFTYTMADGAGAQSTATVTVTIAGVANGLQARADTAASDENAGAVAIDLLANDTDDTTSAAQWRIVSVDTAGRIGGFTIEAQSNGVGVGSIDPGFPATLGGVAVAADGRSVLYTPFQSLKAGETATDWFRYTMSNGAGGTSTADVAVTVTGANDAPNAQADAAMVQANAGPTSIAVLANDADPDAGDSRTVVAVNGAGLQGSVSIGAGGANVVYTPGAAFAGLVLGQQATETFSYTVADAAGAQSTATVTVTVIGADGAPVATPDAATAHEDGAPVFIAVLANDTDPGSGDALAAATLGTADSVSIVKIDAAGLQGTATIGNGGITYAVGGAFQALKAGATALETFSYTVADQAGMQSSADVFVTVFGVNDAPSAADDRFGLTEDAAPLRLDVLANDTDVDVGDTRSIVSVQSAGLVGSVAISADGSALVYTAGVAHQSLMAGQSANETFTYVMRDAAGAQSSATVSVLVQGLDEPMPAGAIQGTTGIDALVGTAGADAIYGLAGADVLTGIGGADYLHGGSDDDALDGGAGNDIIVGGAGRDDLTGGSGADTFQFERASDSTVARSDRIRDFNASEGDRIDLASIDANSVLAGDQAFDLVAAFSGQAGQLVFAQIPASTNYLVQGDTNGDGIADFQIDLRASALIVPADVVLF